MKNTISADVPRDLAESLEAYAAGSGVSLSRLVAGILDEWGRTKGLSFSFLSENPKPKPSVWDNL